MIFLRLLMRYNNRVYYCMSLKRLTPSPPPPPKLVLSSLFFWVDKDIRILTCSHLVYIPLLFWQANLCSYTLLFM